jgi:hypothetical protein
MTLNNNLIHDELMPEQAAVKSDTIVCKKFAQFLVYDFALSVFQMKLFNP